MINELWTTYKFLCFIKGARDSYYYFSPIVSNNCSEFMYDQIIDFKGRFIE